MKHLIHYFSERYVSRWLVLIFDLSIAFASWFLSYVIRFNFDLSSVEKALTPLSFLFIFPALVFCFQRHRSYSGILRHSTLTDIVRIVSAIICTGLILTTISLVGRYLNAPKYFIMPLSVIIIFVLMVSTQLSLSRILVKVVFQWWNNNNDKISKKIMIWGAGQLGQTTYNALLADSSVSFSMVGFIDNNVTLKNKYLTGIPIFSEQEALKKIIKSNKVSEIILAIEKTEFSNKHKRKFADKCIKLGVVVKEVPPLKKWINGELNASSIQRIKIEDLLGRNSIKLDREKIATGLKNSTVLITGAAGSIGSEIVRQLCEFRVKRILLFDKAESDLYNLQQEILRMRGDTDFKAIIGDVTNKVLLRKVFQKYLPTIVFNAAAYKHVPLMEEFPHEAIRVNVKGLKNTADLAIEFNVEKFVLISTDKAVNPTNIMGATKRISEIYVQALAHSGNYSTQFITTRFGNVLGSNGSVVPLFKRQIEAGGPITVTHKDITRFFMTIPEACQLVLEAGFMGKGGEIFVFDMGKPVKIYDLAKKMISLSGFVVNQDIKIQVTGLRPGEKLYEELLTDKERLLQHTYNDKIMIGKDTRHDFNLISRQINLLISNIDNASKHQLVKLIMHMVPEFVSKNSEYSNGKNLVKTTPLPLNGKENSVRKQILNKRRKTRLRNNELIH